MDHVGHQGADLAYVNVKRWRRRTASVCNGVDASAETIREMHRILPHGLRIRLRDPNQHDDFESSESV
jgi:phage tail protein X